MSRQDVLNSLLEYGHPRVQLTPAERIFMTLEHDETSQMAKLWFHFIMFVTVANVTVFISPDLFTASLTKLGVQHVDLYHLYFQNACMTAPGRKNAGLLGLRLRVQLLSPMFPMKGLVSSGLHHRLSLEDGLRSIRSHRGHQTIRPIFRHQQLDQPSHAAWGASSTLCEAV